MATKPASGLPRRVESEHGAAESGRRASRRMALARQTGRLASRQVLRREVAEQLGRKILDDFKSSEFDSNPLADVPEPSGDPTGAQTLQWGAHDDEVGQSVEELVALKARVMHGHEPDEDGLDEGQFIRAVGQLWKSHSKRALSRLFMQIDANSDGRVSWEELITFLLLKDQTSDESALNKFLPPLRHEMQRTTDAAHTAPISHLLHLEDKDRYATLSKDSTLRLWHCGSLLHARTILLPEAGWVTDAAYVPAFKRLAVASAHSKLTLYDATSFRLLHSWRLKSVPQSLCSLEQPSAAEWPACLLVGDQAGMLHVLEWAALTTGRLSATIEATPLHSGWIEKLEYLRDLGGLMSCSSDGTLQLSDLGRGACTVRNRLANPSEKPIGCFCGAATAADGQLREGSRAVRPAEASQF